MHTVSHTHTSHSRPHSHPVSTHALSFTHSNTIFTLSHTLRLIHSKHKSYSHTLTVSHCHVHSHSQSCTLVHIHSLTHNLCPCSHTQPRDIHSLTHSCTLPLSLTHVRTHSRPHTHSQVSHAAHTRVHRLIHVLSHSPTDRLVHTHTHTLSRLSSPEHSPDSHSRFLGPTEAASTLRPREAPEGVTPPPP